MTAEVVPVSRPVLLASLITGFACYAIAAALIGIPPGAADSGEQVVAWFREHRDNVRWSVWAITASLPPLGIVLASLRGVLPAPHRDVFFLGAIAVWLTAPVQAWTWGGLALHADNLDPAVARTVLDVALFWGPVLTGSTITMMLPVTMLSLAGACGLPRWLGVWGVIAIAEQAAETATIFGTSGFFEPGGPMNLQLGAGLVLAWMFAFGAWVARRGL